MSAGAARARGLATARVARLSGAAAALRGVAPRGAALRGTAESAGLAVLARVAALADRAPLAALADRAPVAALAAGLAPGGRERIRSRTVSARVGR